MFPINEHMTAEQYLTLMRAIDKERGWALRAFEETEYW